MIEHKAPPPPLLMAHAKLASKIFITHNLFLMTLWEHLITTILSSVPLGRTILIFLNQYTDLYINQKSFLTGLEVFYFQYFTIFKGIITGTRVTGNKKTQGITLFTEKISGNSTTS